MNERYIVVTSENFSQPMSKEDAIKAVKDYEKEGITGYIISEEEAKRIKSPDNFNTPKWS